MERKFNVLILWEQWTGYMDACTRALQKLLSCRLDIVVTKGPTRDSPFDQSNFFNYPCNCISISDRKFDELKVADYDLVLICSWAEPRYLYLVRHAPARVARLLCMDNQWLGKIKQFAGLAYFRARLAAHYDYAFVPGRRQAKFASLLGFGVDRIIEGHNSGDSTFADQWYAPAQQRFIYAGRLVEEKGLGILARAWRDYVERNERPWGLDICGAGPLGSTLEDLPGVVMHGFVQPRELPSVMARAGVFVLPSVYEPWGMVIHEAAAAGLGVIASSACAAADYFVRPGVNGQIVKPRDVQEFSRALQWAHDLTEDELIAVNLASRTLGRSRSPETWAAAASRPLAYLANGLVGQ